LIYRIKL